jgi:hypothetical protein
VIAEGDCLDFIESPHWRTNKKGGVTWDAWCSKCGFKIENAPFDNGTGTGITGNSRRLSFGSKIKFLEGEVFVSSTRKIYCSDCLENERIH